MSTKNVILKDIYKDDFRIGVACEKVNERFTNNEIGNPDKEALMLKHFNSMTFGNQLKPMYNMGFKSPEATEEYLPFVINPEAKDMLDWCLKNDMPVRGHVLVWHSQCPKEIFCKNYTPVTFPTDPEVLKEKPFMKYFEKLKPECYVSREVLLKRLESYIHSLMEYMYREGYGKLIYAWDVVNEAIELADKTETGLRNTYWYQVIGDDFMFFAFKYAREAELKYSAMYAASYGIDAGDEEALKALRPLLFYNDYNEFQPDKQEAIINALTREGHGHKSIVSEGYLDGIGMQGHLSDNNDIEEYKNAAIKYGKIAPFIHVTELDVKCTCNNVNREYYQAAFYKKFFECLLEAHKEGANITCVTFWGLTDDNSWIRGADPLIFRKDLSEKLSFDAVVYGKTGESIGEPEKIVVDLSDRHIDFEPVNGDEMPAPEDFGIKMLGDGHLMIQDKVVRSGKYALCNDMRFGAWCGIGIDVSDFIGQTVSVSAWVLSPAKRVILKTNNEFTDEIASGESSMDNWVNLSGELTIPCDVHSMYLFFTTEETEEKTFSPVYADDIEIKLVGLKESFENKSNISAIRGMGHLPVLSVTDKESVDGKSHSLMVTRQEKDATVKFDISQYIGHTIEFSAYVKTSDSIIRMGLDGAVPVMLSEVESGANEWKKVSFVTELSKDLLSAEIYVETNGNAEFFVDDIFVHIV